MFDAARSGFESDLQEIRAAGLYKPERILTGPQNARVDLPAQKAVLNFCANNYLGLADDPEVARAAHEAITRWGYGLSSVRFICGTQEIHGQRDARLAGQDKVYRTGAPGLSTRPAQAHGALDALAAPLPDSAERVTGASRWTEPLH
jgi:hypothetical protein